MSCCWRMETELVATMDLPDPPMLTAAAGCRGGPDSVDKSDGIPDRSHLLMPSAEPTFVGKGCHIVNRDSCPARQSRRLLGVVKSNVSALPSDKTERASSVEIVEQSRYQARHSIVNPLPVPLSAAAS